MRKSTKSILAIIGLLTASFSFEACNKLNNGSDFYMEGTLMDTCGGKAIANRPLVALYNALGPVNNHSNETIGLSTTNGSGYFKIKCRNLGNGDIKLVDTLSGEVYIAYYHPKLPLPEDRIDNVGNIYTDFGTFRAIVNIVVDGVFSSDDALYVGTPHDDVKWYYPVKPGTINKQIFFYRISSSVYKQIEHGITWGVGYADFISSYKQVSAVFNICDYPDTTASITINRP